MVKKPMSLSLVLYVVYDCNENTLLFGAPVFPSQPRYQSFSLNGIFQFLRKKGAGNEAGLLCNDNSIQ